MKTLHLESQAKVTQGESKRSFCSQRSFYHDQKEHLQGTGALASLRSVGLLSCALEAVQELCFVGLWNVHLDPVNTRNPKPSQGLGKNLPRTRPWSGVWSPRAV